MLILLAVLLSACATNESELLTTTATTGATLYIDCAFSGKSVGLAEDNYNYNDLIALGMPNDNVSSLRVADGYQVELFLDANCQGRSLTLTGDDGCLVDNNFNDELSSVRVTRISEDPTLLPPAPGGHINMRVLNQTNGAYPDASELLSRLYRSDLGRLPEPRSGLNQRCGRF